MPFRRAVVAVLASALSASAALAQTYPSKPVRLLVPFPPAGPAEIMARVVARTLADGLGEPVVLETQPGGGGTIATEATTRAAPDGYTVALGSLSTLVVGPILNPNVRYDPQKSFTPVSM